MSAQDLHTPQFRAEIVTSDMQMKHALCIRAICFMEENGIPGDQVTDGNDYMSTHFVFYMDREPIGTLRARWFRDFVKLERMSFRKAYRNLDNIRSGVDFVFDHIAQKGYSRVITHAEPRYAMIWRRFFKFRPVKNKLPARLEGHGEGYLELYTDLPPHPEAISLETPADILFRTEGEWSSIGSRLQ